MNKYKRAGLVPSPGCKLRLYRHKDGKREEGWAVMSRKSPFGSAAFVVDRFMVQAHFGTESYPETCYCDERGTSWDYEDEVA